MIVTTELVNGYVDVQEVKTGQDVTMVSLEDLTPTIVKACVYDSGKCIYKVERPCKWWYRHFTFKSDKVQKRLRELIEMEKQRQKTASEQTQQTSNNKQQPQSPTAAPNGNLPEGLEIRDN